MSKIFIISPLSKLSCMTCLLLASSNSFVISILHLSSFFTWQNSREFAFDQHVVAGFLRVMENLENLEKPRIFVEVSEKSWNFFGKWQKSWKSHGICSLVPRIFSNRGEQFKSNFSNLRQVKLPDLTMRTICLLYYVWNWLSPWVWSWKSHGKYGEKYEKSHDVHEQNHMYEPCVVIFCNQTRNSCHTRASCTWVTSFLIY